MAQTIALEGIIPCSVFHFHGDGLIFRFHELSHTYATRLLEQGVGVETVGALLGHASPSITLHYYAHCTTQHKVESVRILHLLNS